MEISSSDDDDIDERIRKCSVQITELSAEERRQHRLAPKRITDGKTFVKKRQRLVILGDYSNMEEVLLVLFHNTFETMESNGFLAFA